MLQNLEILPHRPFPLTCSAGLICHYRKKLSRFHENDEILVFAQKSTFLYFNSMKTSITSISGYEIFSQTSCAILSPALMWKSASLWLNITTPATHQL
jgi:hypothetical protein